MDLLSSLLVLSFLIFFHELGHFLAARLSGVRVDLFSVGFGPTLYSYNGKSTTFVLKAILLGGYVKLHEAKEENDYNLKQSYPHRSPLVKIFILAMGPIANFILAFGLLFVLYSGKQQVPTAMIGQVLNQSCASESNIHKNDIISSINGHPIRHWEDIVKEIKASPSNSLDMILIRNGNPIAVQSCLSSQKRLGIISSNQTITIESSTADALQKSYIRVAELTHMMVNGIKGLILGDISSDKLSGIIGIVDITSKASKSGLETLLYMAAILSLNLALLNLLPIPALDGGHILFNLFELLTRREIPLWLQEKLMLFGWFILIALMLIGLNNDLTRLLS